MVGLVERKISKAAYWSRAIAYFAAPYLAATVLLHRFGKVSTDQTMGLIAFGLVLLLVAFAFAMRALFTLWTTGAKGGKAMIAGLFVSLLLSVPFIIMGTLALQYPSLNDVATDVFNPPQFSQQTRLKQKTLGVSVQNVNRTVYDEDWQADILSAYPKLGPRRYPAGAERVLAAARFLISERGWQTTSILGADGQTINLGEDSDDKKSEKEETDKNNKDGDKKAKDNKSEVEKADEGLLLSIPDDISIDAVSTTLIFKFQNDVTIEIISEAENTLVQMRAASRWGKHDFGENARIIERFMKDLDAALIGIAGEG